MVADRRPDERTGHAATGPGMRGGSERDRLRARFWQLTQAGDGWLQQCAEALRDRPDGLHRLLSPSGADAAALREGPPWPAAGAGGHGDPATALTDEDDDVPAVGAARAVPAVAAALADPASAEDELRRSLTHWRRARIVVGDRAEFPAGFVAHQHRPLRSVLQRLDDLDEGPAAGFAGLIAVALHARAHPAGAAAAVPRWRSARTGTCSPPAAGTASSGTSRTPRDHAGSRPSRTVPVRCGRWRSAPTAGSW